MKKPIKRSKLRRIAGVLYYALKKWGYWHFSGTNFARTLKSDKLPYEVFTHQTLLRRPLKDVDGWMQENKITNLKIALKKLNGLVLEPSQTFSYWLQIGRPTRAKGYKEGMVLHNGTVTAGIGGGLCQLSNLMYWMTLHTPLTVLER